MNRNYMYYILARNLIKKKTWTYAMSSVVFLTTRGLANHLKENWLFLIYILSWYMNKYIFKINIRTYRVCRWRSWNGSTNNSNLEFYVDLDQYKFWKEFSLNWKNKQMSEMKRRKKTHWVLNFRRKEIWKLPNNHSEDTL